MSKRWRWVGSALLLGFVAWRVDWAQVGSAFARTHWPLCLASLATYVSVQIVSSLRWQMLAGCLGFGGSLGRYTRDYYIGMFFNLVLPSSVGGDVVRAWNLSQHDGPAPATGRRAAAAISVLADRVNGVAMLVVLAFVALMTCPTPLPAWIHGTVLGLGAGAILGVAGLPFARRLLGLLPQQSRSVARLQRMVDAALAICRRPGLVTVVTLLSLVVQVVNSVVAWLLGLALDLPVPTLYYGVLVPLVALLTLLPISLNGMGLREAGTVMLLAPLGIPAADALTLSLLLFGVQSVASAGGGLLLLTGGPRPPATIASESDEPPLAMAG